MFSYLKALSPRAPWRYFKKTPRVALDWGCHEIRLLQLEKKGRHYHLEQMLAHPLAPTGQVQKISADLAEEELRTLVSEAGLAGCGVALALPGSAIIKKQIELPLHFNEDELESEVQLRLGQYFPGIPEKEIHFDFTRRTVAEDKQHILLVATRKEQLQRQVNVVLKAGLRPTIVDVDLFALARTGSLCFEGDLESKRKAAALLELRWPVFTFLVFDDADVIFHHQWRIAWEIFEAPLATHSNFMQQVKSVWQLCKATHPKLKIECFGVAGEISGLEQISAQLQQEMSFPVQVINPFHDMTRAPGLTADAVNRFASRFLLCCGLAMRGAVQW